MISLGKTFAVLVSAATYASAAHTFTLRNQCSLYVDLNIQSPLLLWHLILQWSERIHVCTSIIVAESASNTTFPVTTGLVQLILDPSPQLSMPAQAGRPVFLPDGMDAFAITVTAGEEVRAVYDICLCVGLRCFTSFLKAAWPSSISTLEIVGITLNGSVHKTLIISFVAFTPQAYDISNIQGTLILELLHQLLLICTLSVIGFSVGQQILVNGCATVTCTNAGCPCNQAYPPGSTLTYLHAHGCNTNLCCFRHFWILPQREHYRQPCPCMWRRRHRFHDCVLPLVCYG